MPVLLRGYYPHPFFPHTWAGLPFLSPAFLPYYLSPVPPSIYGIWETEETHYVSLQATDEVVLFTYTFCKVQWGLGVGDGKQDQ